MLKRISDLFKPQEQKPTVTEQLDTMLDDARPVTEQLDDMLAESEPMPLETLVEQEEFIGELPEMEQDLGYIQHAPEVVGYDTRELQWSSYRIVANAIEDGASILDFGCGRGDFKVFYAQETGQQYDEIDYTGIDSNQILIDAGKAVYPEIDVRTANWFELPQDLKKDWAINVNSLNLRYDGMTITNWEYFTKTIQSMYDHAERGVIVMLTSDIPKIDDGLINWNPGEVLNWCQGTFGTVAIDHSYSEEMFTLIIYK
jgi:hypothetical protein